MRMQKSVWKEFEIKNLEEYNDLRVESDTLLLADLFENFRNICLKIYQLDATRFFFSSSWISVASSFKRESNEIRYGRKSYKRRNVSVHLLISKS